MNRNGYSAQDAANRIKAQIPLAEKVKLADYVIDNNGPESELPPQVQKIMSTLKDSMALPNSVIAALLLSSLYVIWWF